MITHALRRTSSKRQGKSGKHIILLGNLGSNNLISKDYSNTYNSNVASSIFQGGDTQLSAAISYDGRCQIINKIWGIGLTSDYGNTWEDIEFDGNIVNKVDMSSSGRYILVALRDNILKYTNDFGETWKEIGVANTDGAGSLRNLFISGNGKYQFVSFYGTGAASVSDYYSENYGYTWNTTTNYFIENNSNYYIYSSFDGKVMITSQNISCDYGATCSTLKITDSTYYPIKFSIINNGKIIFVCNRDGLFYKSKDYGVTWTLDSSWKRPGNFLDFAISGDGKYRYVLGRDGEYSPTDGTECTNYILKSEDYGSTWLTINICNGKYNSSGYNWWCAKAIWTNSIH